MSEHIIDNKKNFFYFLLFLSMLSWGGSWVNVKILSSYINEYETMFFRFLITSITTLPVVLLFKKSFKIDLKTFGILLINGTFFIAYMKYFFLGTKFGTASLGGTLVTTLAPIFTFIILAITKNKDVKRKDVIALCLGAIGVLTILDLWSFKTEEIFTLYNFYFILAALLWATITVISSKAVKISPIVFTFYIYIFITIGGAFLIDFQSIPFESFDTLFWINMTLISVGSSTFAYTVYFLGVEKLGAGEVSSFIFLVPFMTVLLSWLFLEEEIKTPMIIGTILTILAVKILNNIKIRGV